MKNMMTNALIAILACAACLMLATTKEARAQGHVYETPRYGSFTNGGWVYTNTITPVGIKVITLYVSGVDTCQMQVVNLTGYTNNLTESTVVTGRHVYADSGMTYSLGIRGELRLSTTCTNTAKWQFCPERLP